MVISKIVCTAVYLFTLPIATVLTTSVLAMIHILILINCFYNNCYHL